MEYTVDYLAREILKALPNRENYSKASLSELLTDDGIDVWDTGFFCRYDVRDQIVKIVKKAGYVLDYSECDNMLGGAPFNEPAVIIKPDAVNEADFVWYNGGFRPIEAIAFVKTKILWQEIQVRLYSGNGFMGGSIFPVEPDQQVEVFSLLEKCVASWDRNDYSVEVCDGGEWEAKLLSGRKLIRKACGTVEKPPLGNQLEKAVRRIVGKKYLYLF